MKKKTYKDYRREMEALAAKIKEREGHLSEVLASGLLTDEVANRLDGYKDSEIKAIAKLMAADIDRYIEQFEAQKQAKAASVQEQEVPVSQLQHDPMAFVQA